MTLRTIFDAYKLPPAWPACDGFMAYAGGDDLHSWSDQEIHQAAATAPECLPVWEYGPGRAGGADGTAFAAWLDGHGVPLGCAALLAMETFVDGPYVEAFAAKMGQREVVLYGSISSLFNNPPQPGGWFPANPTGSPHLFAHPGVIGTQYAWCSLNQTGQFQVDLSLVTETVRLWQPLAGTQGNPVMITTDGRRSLRDLAAAHGGSCAKILRLTAQLGPRGGFPPELATYINHANFSADLPAGIHLWIPA